MKKRGRKGWRMESFPIPTLQYIIHVVVTDDFPKAMKALDIRNNGRMENAGAITFTPAPNYDGESYIFIRKKGRSGERHGQLINEIAHESWHVVRQMFRRAGAELENELVAYHLGYIVEHAYDIWRHE
jgi:hypothetical protein